MIIHDSHVTRFSDSSLYDEICINCLHTDNDRERRLEKECTVPLEQRRTLKQYYKDRETKLANYDKEMK